MNPVTASPNPLEAVIIARAQSLLTEGGKLGPVLSYEAALAVVNAEPTPEPPDGWLAAIFRRAA